jgi:hypothetical protein
MGQARREIDQPTYREPNCGLVSILTLCESRGLPSLRQEKREKRMRLISAEECFSRLDFNVWQDEKIKHWSFAMP